jgi:hypothetical protein
LEQQFEQQELAEMVRQQLELEPWFFVIEQPSWKQFEQPSWKQLEQPSWKQLEQPS